MAVYVGAALYGVGIFLAATQTQRTGEAITRISTNYIILKLGARQIASSKKILP